MQLLRPPLSQCYSSYHLPTLATLTHVLIYIFVNIYLHICIIVHICYGIYLHFCICANICEGCRVAERLEDAALHMSKATDVKLCEMIAHEDKCQFRIPSAYFGTFSQNIFWKHCSYLCIKLWSQKTSPIFTSFGTKSRIWPLSSKCQLKKNRMVRLGNVNSTFIKRSIQDVH